MKISDEVLAYLPEVFRSLPDEPNNRFAVRAFEELQQHRKKLIWHPVCDGIKNELDVFLINLDGRDDLATVHVVCQVSDSYKIDGVDCKREDVYFGQWELEDILEEYPNATWRDIVTDLPEEE